MATPSVNTHEQFKKDLEIVLSDIKELLIEKNEKYGDSALNPVKVFSRLDPLEAIKIRCDDKISRLRNNGDGDTEDPIQDLLGYLLLYKIAEKREAERPKYDTEILNNYHKGPETDWKWEIKSEEWIKSNLSHPDRRSVDDLIKQ